MVSITRCGGRMKEEKRIYKKAINCCHYCGHLAKAKAEHDFSTESYCSRLKFKPIPNPMFIPEWCTLEALNGES